MSGDFEISGRCHCGNIAFTLLAPIPKTELPIRSCDCSFCTRQGATYTSHPRGRLKVQIEDEQSIRWYRYGSETAEVLLCTVCGVFPLITCDIEGQRYAVLNANSINGLYIDRSHLVTIHHDTLSPPEMLRKRQENWIPEVVIETGSLSQGIDPSFY